MELYQKLLQKAGIREMRIHDTRHMFASLLLNNGENPVYVKEHLGHSSIKMIVDIYGHLIPGSNWGAVNRLAVLTPRGMVCNWRALRYEGATGRNLYAN